MQDESKRSFFGGECVKPYTQGPGSGRVAGMWQKRFSSSGGAAARRKAKDAPEQKNTQVCLLVVSNNMQALVAVVIKQRFKRKSLGA
jgi:hypothetical protein